MERTLELSQEKDEVHISDYRKHDQHDHVHDEEIEEVLQHFPQDLDQWTNLLRVLEHGHDSEDETSTRNRKQILELKINVLLKVREKSHLVFFLTQAWNQEIFLDFSYKPLDNPNAADCQNGIGKVQTLESVEPS